MDVHTTDLSHRWSEGRGGNIGCRCRHCLRGAGYTTVQTIHFNWTENAILCWFTDRKHGLSQRLLLSDWMLLTHGSPKNPSDPVYSTHYQRFCQGDGAGCPPVSSIIKTRRLRFFGHVACSGSRQDHHRAVRASL